MHFINFFPSGYPGLTLPYFSRQLIAREVDLERIRRAAPKGGAPSAPAPAAAKKTTTGAAQLPNHLQTLKPKPITSAASNVRSAAPKQQVGSNKGNARICMPCIYLAEQFICKFFVTSKSKQKRNAHMLATGTFPLHPLKNYLLFFLLSLAKSSES